MSGSVDSQLNVSCAGVSYCPVFYTQPAFKVDAHLSSSLHCPNFSSCGFLSNSVYRHDTLQCHQAETFSSASFFIVFFAFSMLPLNYSYHRFLLIILGQSLCREVIDINNLPQAGGVSSPALTDKRLPQHDHPLCI